MRKVRLWAFLLPASCVLMPGMDATAAQARQAEWQVKGRLWGLSPLFDPGFFASSPCHDWGVTIPVQHSIRLHKEL